MTCSWCEERFERFLDGHVTEAERSMLLRHVDGCDNCHGLLEELRVVDALLIEPSPVELPPNFTHATMAEVEALPEPRTCRVPLLAWLVSFTVAAWALIGVAFVLAPTTMIAAGELSLDVAHDVLYAFGGIVRAVGHLGSRGDLSSLTTVAGSVVIADAIVLVAIIAALRFARPLIAERLRW